MAKPKRGRPPARRDEHGRALASSSLPTTTIRLDDRHRALLEAMAAVERRDRSRMVEDALDCRLRSLAGDDRNLVAGMIRKIEADRKR